VGVDNTFGEPLLPFNVIELMVTSKPTTEASGASSPVTNTADVCEDGDEGLDEFDDELQPNPSIESANKNAIPRIRFITNSY
jgi:hypothetical protein